MKKTLLAVCSVITVLIIFFAKYIWQNREPSFTLSTNFEEYSGSELSAGLFNEIISSFSPDIWDFMVLSPNKPVNGSIFIQAGAPEEIVDYQYTLEIGFKNWKNEIKMYRLYTGDKDTVLRYFIDYWQERKTPDISLWEDVSDEMR